MESKIRGFGAYVARLPFLVGYRPSDEHVVVGAFDEASRSIMHGAIQWDDPLPDIQIAQGNADHLARALRGEAVERMIVIGYGPDGPRRATMLADHLARTMLVATTVVHVDGDTWRLQTLDGWGTAHPVPRDSVDKIAQGRPVPAATRQELVDSVAPLEHPLFEPLDVNRARALADLAPAQRLGVAVGAIEALAAGRIDDPGRMQILAHAVTSDPAVREAFLAHSVADTVLDGHVDALVRTFRAAPHDLRPTLALTAAAAAFLAAWHPPLVWGLLKHAAPGEKLTSLLTRALEEGTKPDRFRPLLVQAARDEIDRAQQAREVDRPGGAGDGAQRQAPERRKVRHEAPSVTAERTRPRTPDGPGL